MTPRIKRIVIAITLGAAALGAVTIGLPNWIEAHGPAVLSEALHARGIKASIQSVESETLFSYTLRKVNVEAPVSAQAERVAVEIAPWRFFRLSATERYLIGVRIDGLDADTARTSRSSALSRFPVSWIPIDIEVRSGQIAADFSGSDVTVVVSSVSVRAGPFGWRGSFAGSESGFGPITGSVTVSPRGNLAISADIADLQVGSLGRFTEVEVPVSGRLAAKLDVSGNTAGEEAIDWSASFRTKDALLHLGPGRSVEMRAKGRISQKEFQVSGDIGRALRVDGRIHHPFKSPDLNLQVRHESGTLSALLSAFSGVDGRGARVVDGPFRADIRLTGSLRTPSVNGTFEFDPTDGRIRLPTIAGRVGPSASGLAFESDVGAGRIALDVPFSASDRWATLALEGLDLATIAELNGWSNVSGIVGGHLRARLGGSVPRINGRIRLGQLAWGRLSRPEPVQVRINVEDDRLEFQTDDESIDIAAQLESGGMIVDKFSVRFGTATAITGSGSISDEAGVALSVSGQGIPPDTWPPLVRRYPAISGFLDFDGRITGHPGRLESKLDVVFRNLSFIEGGETWNGDTAFFWTGDGFTLKSVRIDGGYNGDVTWKRERGVGEWDIAATISDANPRLLWEIMKSSEAVFGKIDGDVKLGIRGGAVDGRASVAWRAGGFGNIRFDRLEGEFVASDGALKVDAFEVLSGASALRARGEIKLGAPDWRFDLALQAQQSGTERIKVDGEGFFRGTFDPSRRTMRGKVESPVLWINGFAWENLALDFEANGPSWTVAGSLGEDGHVDGAFDQKTGRLRGVVKIARLPLKEATGKLFAPFGVDQFEEGEARATLNLRGTVADPHLQVNASLEKARWRGTAFDSNIYLDIRGSTVSIVSSKTDFREGGTVFADGALFMGDVPVLRLEGVGSQLRLNALFRLLRWPTRWNGKTNLTFSVNGGKSNREIRLVFDGEHEGFGPFSGDGTIAGAATLEKGQWDLAGIQVLSGNGLVRLAKGSRIFIDRSGAGRIRVVADTRNLKAGLLTFFGRVELAGGWESRRERGPDQEQAREFDVFARSLWVNQFVLNGNIAHLSFEKGRTTFSPIIGTEQRLSGRLDYSAYPEIRVENLTLVENGEERLFLNGWVGRPRWDFEFRGRDIDGQMVRGLFDTNWPVTGLMDLRLNGTGRLDSPIVTGTVALKNGHFGRLPIDLATAKVDFENGILRLDRVYARKKKGYFLKGAVTLGTAITDAGRRQRPEVFLKVERGNAAILEEMSPDVIRARGDFEAQLMIGRVAGKRSVSGFLKADDLYLRSHGHIPHMRKGKIHLRLEEDRLDVLEAEARLGEGNAHVEGTILFAAALPSHFDLRIYSSGRRGPTVQVPELAIPPGPVLGRFSILKKRLAGISRGDPVFDLHFSGPASGPTMAGTVRLENTVFTFPPTNPSGDNRVDRGALARWFKDVMRRTTWDVVLDAGERTRYENKLVDAKVTGSLHIKGRSSELAVSGRIHTDQGSIIYAGNEFEVVDAALEVLTQRPTLNEAGRGQIYVYLRATAEKDVYYTDGLGDGNEDTIIMEVDRSLLGEIQPRFRSKNNPGLSSQRALQLALGLPISETIDGNRIISDQPGVNTDRNFDRVLRANLVQLLDASLASPLARAIARQTGLVDFIRVTYAAGENDVATEYAGEGRGDLGSGDVTQNEWLRYMKGTKVKMGRELTGRLFADYSFRVDEFENQIDLRHEVELAYRLHRNLFLRATSELDNERTLGRPPDRRAILENRWRFGLPRKSTPHEAEPPPAEEPLAAENR